VLLDIGLEPKALAHFLDHAIQHTAVPVIVAGQIKEIPLLTQCVQDGAQDYLLLPTNSTLLMARFLFLVWKQGSSKALPRTAESRIAWLMLLAIIAVFPLAIAEAGQLMANVVREVLAYAPPQWLIPFAALVVSHGISFVANFLLGGERDELRLRQIMGSPYGRIVVLHIAVIFGAVAVTALGQPIAMLVVLTLLKVAVDVKLHLREHYRAAPD